MLQDKKIIFEQAYTDADTQILEESVAPGGQYKLTFRAKLQEADVINNNKRVYPAATLESVYEQLKEKALARKLIGEMDHPQPQGDQAAKIKRSSTISLEKACFLIKDLEWDGSAIYGICETLSNRMGRDLYCLLKDGVTVGFSLRAFGETRQKGGGVVEVIAKGLKSLTYDLVANPSHDSSVIIDMFEESNARDIISDLKQEVIEESSKITEKLALLEVGNTNSYSEGTNKTLLEETSITAQLNENLSKKICVGNICSVAPLEEAITYIVDEIVSNNTIPKVSVKKF